MTVAITRFDPDENTPQGTCQNCGQELAAKSDVDKHLSESVKDGRSHRVRITNPSREDRIRSEIERLIQNAVDDVVEEIQDLVDGEHLSNEEAAAALRGYDDFSEGWRNAAA